MLEQHCPVDISFQAVKESTASAHLTVTVAHQLCSLQNAAANQSLVLQLPNNGESLRKTQIVEVPHWQASRFLSSQGRIAQGMRAG